MLVWPPSILFLISDETRRASRKQTGTELTGDWRFGNEVRGLFTCSRSSSTRLARPLRVPVSVKPLRKQRERCNRKSDRRYTFYEFETVKILYQLLGHYSPSDIQPKFLTPCLDEQTKESYVQQLIRSWFLIIR